MKRFVFAALALTPLPALAQAPGPQSGFVPYTMTEERQGEIVKYLFQNCLGKHECDFGAAVIGTLGQYEQEAQNKAAQAAVKARADEEAKKGSTEAKPAEPAP